MAEYETKDRPVVRVGGNLHKLTPIVALERIVIVAFRAPMSAALSDSIR
jgi:hypothetical protein